MDHEKCRDERSHSGVSNGFNCDGMEIITYFSGGKEIAKEICAIMECNNDWQNTRREGLRSITGQEHCDVSLRMQTIKSSWP